MTYTADDVDRVMTRWDDDYESGWMRFKYPYPKDRAEQSELGEIRHVAEYGGEGQGDEYWAVVSITDSAGAVRWFKRHGYYQSYSGGYLDGPTEEVKPVERVVTFYE